MLIEAFAPNPDAVEIHTIEIAAPCEAVYRALWTANLAGSPVIQGLMTLRSLPEAVLHPSRRRHPAQKVTLQTLIDAGFGQLAEEPGREIVLGLVGRFWRPVGNLVPFRQEYFQGSVPPGLARAVWNLTVQKTDSGQTLLSTETRIVCGDPRSRWKFRAYWLFVRPFSGLIRILMLRAVRQECENVSSDRLAS